MADILIRDVPDDVVASLDARAKELGLSRVEYVRRRLAQELPPRPRVTREDLERLSEAFADALDPEVMLYDEPTTGLDPIMTDVINELILQTRSQRPITSIVVTHEMRTVYKCAERVVMLYPLARLGADERQVLYDGPPAGLADARDPRVLQFIQGEARDRLQELERQEGTP